jgi:hypothetical protein
MLVDEFLKVAASSIQKTDLSKLFTKSDLPHASALGKSVKKSDVVKALKSSNVAADKIKFKTAPPKFK